MDSKFVGWGGGVMFIKASFDPMLGNHEPSFSLGVVPEIFSELGDWTLERGGIQLEGGF